MRLTAARLERTCIENIARNTLLDDDDDDVDDNYVNVLVNNDAHHIYLPMNVIRRNSFFNPTLSRRQQHQQQLQLPRVSVIHCS